jgi:hypothetical protein
MYEDYLRSHAVVLEVNAGMHKFSKNLGATSQILGARRVTDIRHCRTKFILPGNAHPRINNAHLVLFMTVYMRMQPILDAPRSEDGGGEIFLGRKPTSVFISAVTYGDSAVCLYVKVPHSALFCFCRVFLPPLA